LDENGTLDNELEFANDGQTPTLTGDAVADADLVTNRPLQIYNKGEQGVFALHPLSTPKYAKNNSLASGTARDAEYKETLARMYLSLSEEQYEFKQTYISRLPTEAQELAKLLVGTGTSSKEIGTGFIDFLLSQANESFQEKVQIDEVLSDNYVAYFFGQAPPVFQYSGYLFNTFQDDQRVGMLRAYAHMLRGFKCAQLGSLLRLRYDSVIVSGTILSMSQVMNAENEMVVPFNFSLLVKEYVIMPQLRARQATDKLTEPFASAFTTIGTIRQPRFRSTIVHASAQNESTAGKDTPTTGESTGNTVEDAKKIQASDPLDTVVAHLAASHKMTPR